MAAAGSTAAVILTRFIARTALAGRDRDHWTRCVHSGHGGSARVGRADHEARQPGLVGLDPHVEHRPSAWPAVATTRRTSWGSTRKDAFMGCRASAINRGS